MLWRQHTWQVSVLIEPGEKQRHVVAVVHARDRRGAIVKAMRIALRDEGLFRHLTVDVTPT